MRRMRDDDQKKKKKISFFYSVFYCIFNNTICIYNTYVLFSIISCSNVCISSFFYDSLSVSFIVMILITRVYDL